MNRIARFLLPVAAVGVLGAAATASVIANPSGRAATNPSEPVSVQPIGTVGGYFTNHVDAVPANNRPQRVDDVFAFEGDSDYAIEALRAEVTSQGVMSSDCGPVAQRPYGLGNERLPTGDIPDGPQGVRIADLTLTLPATVGDGCVVAGGVVTILFQAVDGPDS